MTCQCIRCQKRWDDGKTETALIGIISHGFCKPCARILLIATVRKRQLAEGYFDCFGKAEGDCDQAACKYRLVCIKEAR